MQTLADFAGNFSERLMDGRYPGAFWRPLVNLSFALDHALWGLDPVGFQLTNAVLLVVSALALSRLFGRLLRDSGSRWGTVVCVLVFVSDPLQWEVLPVPARRPELLCCALMALALSAQLSPRALARRGLVAGPAVLTLLALGAKETALVLPALVALVVWLYSERPTPRERLREVVTALVPHLVAVGLMLSARLAVLGGLGGHAPLETAQALAGAPWALVKIAAGVLLPQAAMAGPAGLALSSVALGSLALALSRARSADPPREHGPAAAIVGCAWIVVVALVYGAVGLIAPWYFLLPAAGFALLAAAVCEWLVSAAGSADRALSVLATLALAALTVLLVWRASYSPLVRRYDEWPRATAAAARFEQEALERLRTAPSGSVVAAPPLPTRAVPRCPAPCVQGAHIFADYSVEAWLELTEPERRVRVRYAERGGTAVAPDEVLLEITSRFDP